MICCILAYYFFKHRNIWNQLFEIKNINTNIYHLLEYFECPKHSLFWIPNIIPTSINCSSCKEELIENEYFHRQLETLGTIYSLFKQLDTNVLNNLDQFVRQYKMFMWLLEGSIKDYELIKKESNNVYYKLKDTYFETYNTNTQDKYKDNDKDKEDNSNDSNNDTGGEITMDIENLPYLEYNIEIFDKIITCIWEYYKHFKENDRYDGYLNALFIDILDYARINNMKIKLQQNN